MTEEQKPQGIRQTGSTAERLAMGAFAGLQRVTDQLATFETIAPGTAYMRILLVNVCFLYSDREWILVDTGLPGAAESIIEAGSRLTHSPKPAAIILTHGHFDHVGSITELLEEWDVPVFAHEEELPYLTSQQNYPPPDPTADPRLMARMARLYPHRAIDLSGRVTALPADGSVPGAPKWRWIHTPGHTPGHISLFRASDRVLIAGDAFITVEQESALAVALQEKDISGPPEYFTIDWDTARESIRCLAELNPRVAITGHGLPLQGEELTKSLEELVRLN